MGFKVVKLTVGKGKTTGDEKAGKWDRQYYEVEAIIKDESQLELAKNSLEALLDMWLRGESITEPEKLSWDPDKIKWEPVEGSSGPYERSGDVNNPEFKNMLKDLASHKGRLTKNGFFYWTFKNGSTVGRKRREKRKVEKTAEIDRVKALFPKELQDLLNFELAKGCCLIKPRGFMGSDNFSKVLEIVKGQGGEYVSQRKDSHFRVPLKS